MALRKWHFFWAIIVYLLYIGVYWYLVEYIQLTQLTGAPPLNIIWVITGLLLCVLGGEMSDYDQLTSLLSHRDIITHSGLIPTLVFLPFVVNKLSSSSEFMNYTLIFAPFMVGYGTHLLLDLFPTIDPERTTKKEGLVAASIQLFGTTIQGLTSAELVSRIAGTYLIHLPIRMKILQDGSTKQKGMFQTRKTLPKHWTRWWLFLSGIYCYFLAVLTLNLYIGFLPF